MKQLVLDLAQAPPATFANFVAGRNAELFANVQRLCDGNAKERFIYVWGAEGSGRTHLLHAAVAACEAVSTHAEYLACGRGMRQAVPAEAVLVAVDDVDRLDEAGQGALFALYNSLRECGGRLLASGGAPPAGLALRHDLVTRLGWGLVYQIHALSDEEKRAALKHQARARGFDLSDDVCAYLLARVRRDMPSLLAMLEALDRYSLEAKRPVTVALVRELLKADRQKIED